MDDWTKFISTLGFPIAITCYVMIRLESTLKDLTRTVTKLILVLAKKGVTIDDTNGA